MYISCGIDSLTYLSEIVIAIILLAQACSSLLIEGRAISVVRVYVQLLGKKDSGFCVATKIVRRLGSSEESFTVQKPGAIVSCMCICDRCDCI